jgi:hypothetical protein
MTGAVVTRDVPTGVKWRVAVCGNVAALCPGDIQIPRHGAQTNRPRPSREARGGSVLLGVGGRSAVDFDGEGVVRVRLAHRAAGDLVIAVAEGARCRRKVARPAHVNGSVTIVRTVNGAGQ